MIADADLIERGLKNFEAGVHRDGWDQNSIFTTIFQIGDRLASLPLQGPADFNPGSVAIQAFADMLREKDAEYPTAWAQAGFVGLAYCFEGWAAPPEMTNEEYVNRDRDLGDTVGARECRTVMMVDTSGRVFQVFRIRGQKPTVGQMRGIGGSIAGPLVDAVTAVSELLPPGDADLDALHRVKVFTDEQVLTMRQESNEQAAGQAGN